MEDEHKQQHKMVKLHVETAEVLDKIRFSRSWCKKLSYDHVVNILLEEHFNYELMSKLVDIQREVKLGGSSYKMSIKRLNDKVNEII